MLRLALSCAAAFASLSSSATAQELAFVSERGGETTEIYAIAADGTGERNLSRSPEPDEWPDWSPDGAQVAFGRGFGSDAEIWVMAADGSAQRRLTDTEGPDRAPDWSPDGRRIVFVSERGGSGAELHVMNADGSGATQLTRSGGVAAAPAWSPNGTRVAYWREDVAQLWIINADGSGDRPVDTGPAADRDPTWSPDGTRLAFTTMRESTTELDLYTVGSDGSAVSPLAALPSRDIEPAWSVDGIAFASDRAGDLDIWAMAADGSGARRVTTSPGDDTAPDWRPRPASFTGTLPGQGGSIVVGGPGMTPGQRRGAQQGRVRLTMRSSSVAVRRRRLVVSLRFVLSAPATGTFRVHHRGRVVASKLYRGRRGVNVLRITRRVHDPRRWNGVYRMTVVNFRRRG